jgi:hypothetical protein
MKKLEIDKCKDVLKIGHDVILYDSQKKLFLKGIVISKCDDCFFIANKEKEQGMNGFNLKGYKYNYGVYFKNILNKDHFWIEINNNFVKRILNLIKIKQNGNKNRT